MAMQDPQAEPSMEEILASIRRIISEEEQAAPAEPVLDLTQTEEAAPEDDIVFEAVEEAPPAAQPRYEPPPQAPAPTPAPAANAAAPQIEQTDVAPETIISPPAASAAAEALAKLAGTLRISDTPNQTLEGMVRELLRPMLKEWLERNLPSIVEARVEAELERIARMVR